MIRFNLDARPKPKVWTPGRDFRFIEEKHDGHRYTIIRNEHRIRMIGRKIDNDIWPKVGHLFPSVQSLPLNTILDGELIVCDGHATSVSSAIATADESLQFIPFAAPFWAGQDMRTACLRIVRSMLTRRGWQVPRQFVPDEYDITEEFLKDMADGLCIEGFVLKLEHYAGWWKIKPERTIDAVIMSVKMGTPGSEFDGVIGSLEVGLYDQDGELRSIGTLGSGFTFKEREEWFWIKDDLIGEVVEVEYQDIAARGRLKFARFKRWRQDKPADECTMEQIR